MAKLRVHNIESGPASSDVALGISGDTIAVSSDSLKLNVWKDSGGNTLFQSDGAGTLSNVNSSFSGAGPKLILSQTASSSASISFTSDIDSTYDHYMFVFVNINPATDATGFQFQVNASGESGFNETITSTAFAAWHGEAGAGASLNYDTSMDQAQGTSYQPMSSSQSNAADSGLGGILHLFGPSSTTYVKQFYLHTNSFTSNATPNNNDFYIAGYINVTAAITEIDFKFSSGNFDGIIKMYGIA